MYNNNVSSIKSILTPLIATTKLTAVYDYDVKSVDSYPFAKISVIDWEWDFFDTANNKLVSNYRISIINQANITSASEVLMRQLVDLVITELNKKTNVTLWWTVDRFIPISVSWGWTESNEPLRICDITVEVMETINI